VKIFFKIKQRRRDDFFSETVRKSLFYIGIQQTVLSVFQRFVYFFPRFKRFRTFFFSKVFLQLYTLLHIYAQIITGGSSQLQVDCKSVARQSKSADFAPDAHLNLS